VKFFLVAVLETARKGRSTFHQILRLRSTLEPRLLELGKRARLAQRLLTVLYRKPFVSLADIANELDVTHPTASALARDFVRLKILRETTRSKRNRLYVFDRYYRLFLV
jgi:Fic family protein